MKSKIERIKKIRSFLRLQSSPQTISEIHEAMNKRLGLDISRKTIERDICELMEEGLLLVKEGIPSKYSPSHPLEFEVLLKLEEINHILSKLDIDSDLYQKLSRLLIRGSNEMF
jgi:DeoR/GlpR family transcriptional regulator of sugar metabolism